MVGAECAPVTVTVGFPNEVTDTSPFICAGLDLTLHSETVDINGTTYYALKSETPADGTASTVSVVFNAGTTGRQSPTSNTGRFIFPLTRVSAIPAANWDLTYRVKRDKVNGGWTWFTHAVDTSLSSTGSWADIDLSGSVLVGATEVVVEMVNTAAAVAHNGVLRFKEDIIDYMSNPNFGEIYDATHRWQVVKLNSSREIQGQISDTDINFKLMGYTIGSDPVFFPNDPIDITPIAANSWTTWRLTYMPRRPATTPERLYLWTSE